MAIVLQIFPVHWRMFLGVISPAGLQGSLLPTSYTRENAQGGQATGKSRTPHIVCTMRLEEPLTHILLAFHCSSSVRLCDQLCFFAVCGKANFLLVQHKLERPCLTSETESLDQVNNKNKTNQTRTNNIFKGKAKQSNWNKVWELHTPNKENWIITPTSHPPQVCPALWFSSPGTMQCRKSKYTNKPICS